MDGLPDGTKNNHFILHLCLLLFFILLLSVLKSFHTTLRFRINGEGQTKRGGGQNKGWGIDKLINGEKSKIKK